MQKHTRKILTKIKKTLGSETLQTGVSFPAGGSVAPGGCCAPWGRESLVDTKVRPSMSWSLSWSTFLSTS